jgi:hypothetical protein
MNEFCARIEEKLSDFLEGALSPDAAVAFSAHLDTCPSCAQMVAQVRDLTSELHAIGLTPEPPFLASKIVAATLGAPESGWRQWLAWPSLIWQPQFAMGAVTVAASLLILLHATVDKGGNSSLADMNPVSVARVANRRVHLAYAHGVRFVNDLRFVYDIESRLAQPDPINGSVNGPEHPQQPEPSSDPRQKSNVVPDENHNSMRTPALAAALEGNSLGPLGWTNFQRSTP